MTTLILLCGFALVALAVLRIFVLPYMVMGAQALDQFAARTEHWLAGGALGAVALAMLVLPFVGFDVAAEASMMQIAAR
jgi:branched-subunit amino acid transport protein AzlD